jgi:hypothetical protein
MGEYLQKATIRGAFRGGRGTHRCILVGMLRVENKVDSGDQPMHTGWYVAGT